MALSKRSIVAVLALALALTACMGLAGCGKNNAATWSHGEVTEDEVTTTINNMRSYYSLTDDDAWAQFVQKRSYDSSTAQTEQSATEKAITNATGQTTTDSSQDESVGTAEDMRTYVIEQLIRNDIIQYQIKEMGITASDEDVDAYVEQQRAYVESQYMPGVFESVLQRQGYASLDAYKQEIREQLKVYNLEQAIAPKTADDGSTSVDETAWNAWLDDQYANADVKINPAPSPLEYDIVVSSDDSTSSSASSTTQSSSTQASQSESSN